MFVFYALILVAGLVCETEARVTSEVCQVKPQKQYCVSGNVARASWDLKRYAFDWEEQKCYEISFIDYCVLKTEGTNNFGTEQECIDNCSGWA